MSEFGKMKQLLAERNIVLRGGDIISTGGGVTQVPNFILVSKKISVGAKLTYAMLLKYAWSHDYCFPGQNRLAEDMGCTRQSVNKFIKELSTAGYVDVERRGQGRPNLYELNLNVDKRKRKT